MDSSEKSWNKLTDHEKEERFTNIKYLLRGGNLERQTLVDDLIYGLPGPKLSELFEYCREMYKSNESKVYYEAMGRIANVAKNRQLAAEVNSIPIHKYVSFLTSERNEWPIAYNPDYWS